MRLWVFTSRAIRAVADKEGYSKIIRDAGGIVMTDTCSAIGQALAAEHESGGAGLREAGSLPARDHGH